MPATKSVWPVRIREEEKARAWFKNGGFAVTQTSGAAQRMNAGIQKTEVIHGAAIAAPDQVRSG